MGACTAVMANGPTSNVIQITDLFAFVRNNKMVQRKIQRWATAANTLTLIESENQRERESEKAKRIVNLCDEANMANT